YDRLVGGHALGLRDVSGRSFVVAGRVHRQADDLDPAAVELRLDLGHVAEFGRADRGEILGVREQHRPRIADPLVKADPALGRLSLEVWGGVSDGQRHLFLLLLHCWGAVTWTIRGDCSLSVPRAR